MPLSVSRPDGVSAVPPAPISDGLFTIGDMARAFDISQRTLRFYEDRGLLSPRREGASRLYTDADRRKLEIILRGKRLGFTLTEIIGLLAGGGSGASALTLDREQIVQQISHLERQREGLDTALAELRATLQQI